MRWISLFLLACCANVDVSFAKVHLPTSERKALIDLFQYTRGDNWDDAEGWLSTETGAPNIEGSECEWRGVRCDRSGRHVIAILLRHNALRGVLPSSLKNLTRLDTLDLSFNYLDGSIPESLYKLKRLERLDLSGNKLSGSLQLTRANLPKLKYLSLARNYLTGGINDLAKLPALEELDLTGNQFDGPLSPSFGSLHHLKALSLSSNALVGVIPGEIGRLDSLEYLSFSRNDLSGQLPAQIAELSHLRSLDLSHNHFAGPMPDELGRLKDLAELRANNNEFTAYFPALICHDSLNFVDLSFNNLTGQLPAEIGSCSELRDLNLAQNKLSGEFSPSFLSHFATLRSLNLSGNHLTGGLPPLLAASELRNLDLSDNELKGEIPPGWSDLRELRLDRNNLSGSIPQSLFSDSIWILTLSSNQFVGPIPDTLCTAAGLHTLDLSHNRLVGFPCHNLEDLPSLKILNLSYNEFSGNIPAFFFGLNNLSSLILSHNAYEGSLPAEGNLSSLQALDVSYNSLTGLVPQWLSHASVLRMVILRANRFNAGFKALTDIKSLRFADLRDNDWSEPIPQKLLRLQNASRAEIELIDQSVFRKDESLAIPPKLPSAPSPANLPTPIPVPGQAETSIVGVVVDATGAAIPGADVTAESESSKKTTKTNEDGQYQISLPVGIYRITASYSGFVKKVSEPIAISVGALQTFDITLSAQASSKETITISAETELPRGPWWNSWLTTKGAPESSKVRILKPGQNYSFYLELSAIPKLELERGEKSYEISRPLRQRLAELLTDGSVETSLFVRVGVIGRAATLTGSIGSVGEWTPNGWIARGESSSVAALNVDLTKLLPKESPKLDSAIPDSSFAFRGGGVRFDIGAVEPGCAAIAVSIWDETRTIPLDHLVRIVGVGEGNNCGAEIDEREAVPTLYSNASNEVAPDASLDVFEFQVSGAMHSATFMALKKPTADCESYHWSTDATLTELVLNSNEFKNDLDEARRTDGVYASIGGQIADAVFPDRANPGKCGSADAFESLRRIGQDRDIRLFARVSDRGGRLAIAPLGLLSVLEQDGTPVFAHDIKLFQPMSRESLSETACVGSWTFVLPSVLKGDSERKLQTLRPPIDSDSRVVRSKAAFVDGFIKSLGESEDPLGLLLLAHHQDGILTFSATGDTLGYNAFNKGLGDGSIAILSACETANLTASTKLVDELNAKGVDGLIAASFELDKDYGIRFALNFTETIEKSEGRPIALEDAFNKALVMTANELARSKGKRVRGMGLELVLAGNPRLQICVPESSAH